MLRKKGIVLGFVAGLTAGLLFGSVVAQTGGFDKSDWQKKFFSPLYFAVRQVQARYVEEVDPQKLLVGAYHGILSQLDDYSSYIPAKRLEEFEGDTKGEFGGLGIEIRYYPLKNMLRVEQPIPGTPAFRAGVLAGDIITKVREESTGKVYDTTEFETVHDAVRVLRGEVGTKVTITVFHQETREEEVMTITRQTIKIPGVRTSGIVDEERKIGYAYVPSFHQGTADDLRKAIKEMQKEDVQGLILDLRFNPGGLLASAIEVSDMFLEDAVVVSTRGRVSDEQVFRTRSKDLLLDAPMIVLVNRYSASASEIVAGAIKANQRGLLVGEKTFGKGSVQSILPLKDRESAIKLTTARYYTPDGVCIEEKGIEPEIEIRLSTEENRALALELAEREDPPKPEEKNEDAEEKPPVEGPPTEAPGEENEEPEEEPFEDLQLQRAMDILKGIIIREQYTAKGIKPAEAAQK